jgi:hypothetical protein
MQRTILNAIYLYIWESALNPPKIQYLAFSKLLSVVPYDHPSLRYDDK